MKILIIGGNGYIGSFLTKHLPFSTLSIGCRDNDYYSYSTDFFQSYEYIILLAGHSSVQMCLGPLQGPWLNNVSNFKTLIEKTTPEQKIIYASSSSVYGNKNTKIGTEDDLSLDYINNYDLTKSTLDLYALQQINMGRSIIGLRFGTVNGGSPVIRRDLMINSMVYNALNDGKIFVTNKHVHRPILFIKDLSKAIYTILKLEPSVGFASGIYNLASFNTTVDVISQEVSKQTGIPVTELEDKPGVYNFAISSEKFKKTYSFNFEGTPESVVSHVLECYKYKKPNIVIRNEYFNYTRP